MAVSNELDCTIYLETDQAPDQVVALLAAGLAGNDSGAAVGKTIRTKYGEVEVRKNKEASQEHARAFPDGFLYFRHMLEVYPSTTARFEDRVSFVTSIL